MIGESKFQRRNLRRLRSAKWISAKSAHDYLDHNQPMPFFLLADAASSTALEQFVQRCLIGLAMGSLVLA